MAWFWQKGLTLRQKTWRWTIGLRRPWLGYVVCWAPSPCVLLLLQIPGCPFRDGHGRHVKKALGPGTSMGEISGDGETRYASRLHADLGRDSSWSWQVGGGGVAECCVAAWCSVRWKQHRHPNGDGDVGEGTQRCYTGESLEAKRVESRCALMSGHAQQRWPVLRSYTAW